MVGIRDKALSERMQLDPKLTLETAKTLTRQREAVHEQQQILRGSTKKEVLVENIWQPRNRGARNHSQPRTGTQESSKCSRCGQAPHPRQSCPAKDAVCHKCQRKGHYSAQCFSKMAVKEVTQTEPSPDHLEGPGENQWKPSAFQTGHRGRGYSDFGGDIEFHWQGRTAEFKQETVRPGQPESGGSWRDICHNFLQGSIR